MKRIISAAAIASFVGGMLFFVSAPNAEAKTVSWGELKCMYHTKCAQQLPADDDKDKG